MKKMCVSMIMLLISAAFFCYGESTGSKNVFNAMVYSRWLSKETVNFENLKYTDSQPVFLFWAQVAG